LPRSFFRVDRAVPAPAFRSGPSAGRGEPLGHDPGVVLAMGVDDEEQEGEADLGGTASPRVSHGWVCVPNVVNSHVEDTVGDDLGVN